MSNTANVASELIRITITLLLSKDKCELSKTEKLWATPLNSINIISGSFFRKGGCSFMFFTPKFIPITHWNWKVVPNIGDHDQKANFYRS